MKTFTDGLNFCIKNQNWDEKISEIGYLAFPLARGKGMVPFLVKELAKIVLLDYKMNRVEIRCDPKNSNSGRAAEKAGFTFEGTLRNSKMYRGDPSDTQIFSPIPSDFDRQ